MQVAPSCVTTNFACSYMMEVSIKYHGQRYMSNTTDLEYEVHVDNDELHR